MCALHRRMLSPNDHFWPILLKKSAMVSTTEKYALEIEIFILNMGFWAQISRIDAQKRRFQQSVWGAVWENRLFQQNRPIAVIE